MDRTLYTDNHTYLPGDLLVKADRMTMAHSLEGRSPFLDHEIASWAARLPTSMKVNRRTGKYLLRKAFADELPPSVGGRGKQGFSVPLGAWFRDSLSDWAEDILLNSDNCLKMWFNPSVVRTLLDEHKRGKENHGKRIYALVVLGLWDQLNQ
jgi:asparagine synthase (glutamine-hydrolysing)